MKKNNIINLLKRHFIENGKKEMRTWIAVLCCFIFFGYFNNVNLMIIFLAIFSIVYASGSFRIFDNTQKGMNYLMIPANTMDKLVANGIICYLYINIVLIVLYLMGTMVGGAVNSVVNTHSLNAINYDSLRKINIDNFMTIICFQSVFIFGSIYFKKNAVVKTILWIIGICVAFLAIDGMILLTATKLLNTNMMGISNIMNTYEFKIFDVIMTILLTLYCWVISYFRLRETEV